MKLHLFLMYNALNRAVLHKLRLIESERDRAMLEQESNNLDTKEYAKISKASHRVVYIYIAVL